MHLCLGTDIDASGRIVEKQYYRIDRQPLCQHDLLLVAAGKGRNLGISVAEADPEAVDEVLGKAMDGAITDDAESRYEPFKHDQDDVLLDGSVHEQSFSAPV